MEEQEDQVIDKIRNNKVGTDLDLHELWKQEQAGVAWEDLEGVEKAIGVTEQDSEPVEGERRKVPAAIYFSSILLDYQKRQTKPFSVWTDELISEVTAPNAMSVYESKGNDDISPRPVDGLYKPSLHRTLFHEVRPTPSPQASCYSLSCLILIVSTDCLT